MRYLVFKWPLATGLLLFILYFKICGCRNLPIQWTRGLRREFAAARLLGFRVNIPLEYGCPSLVTVVCYQVEFSAAG
jgi:hypothetical protein